MQSGEIVIGNQQHPAFDSTAPILISGDFCPHGGVRNRLISERPEELWGDFHPLLQQSGLFVANLECPLIEEPAPILKTGPVLGASRDCVQGLQSAGISLVNIGNNHIMDHGCSGFQTTIDTLDSVGIGYFGAGSNIEIAGQIKTRIVNGLRIGFISYSEHEFSIAGRNKAGANPLDIIHFVRNINFFKESCDYLIVFLHAGNEMYQYPRPSLVNLCRFMVEQGANAVICQHSHCVGCFELYRNGFILYGQGNFVFPPLQSVEDPLWMEGVLVKIIPASGMAGQISLLPYSQSTTGHLLTPLTEERAREFQTEIQIRNRVLENIEKLEEQWDIFCTKRKISYRKSLFSDGSMIHRLLNKFNLQRIPDKQRLLKLNLIRCESHREALLNILENELS